MPQLIRLTSSLADKLVDYFVDLSTAPLEPLGAGDTHTLIVVMTEHHKRDLVARLSLRDSSVLGHRVMTIQNVLDHYASSLESTPSLTPLQTRSLIEHLLETTPPDVLAKFWPMSVHEGKISDRVIDTVTRMCSDLDRSHYTTSPIEQTDNIQGWGPFAEDLNSLLALDPIPERAKRKQLALFIHQRYAELLSRAGCHPLSSLRHRAAHCAATSPLLASRILIWAEAPSPNDAVVHLAAALWASADLETLTIAHTTSHAPHWPGTATLAWNRYFATRPHEEIVLAAAARSSLVLTTLSTSPLAYEQPPVPTDDSLSVTRYMDARAEAIGVARQISLLIEQGCDPNNIAIVARDMPERSTLLEEALRGQSIEASTSLLRPISSAPSIKALRAYFQLLALSWAPEYLLPVLTSPYFQLPLSIRDLDVTQGTLSPVTLEEWRHRLPLRPHTEGTLRSLEELSADQSQVCPGPTQTPRAWADALRALLERWNFEATIYAPLALDERAHTMLMRHDIDSLNALVRATDEWLRACEVGAHASRAYAPIEWLKTFEQIIAATTVRLSSYARDTVELLTPRTAIGRKWNVVFVVGLLDGIWPRKYNDDWSPIECDALLLPSTDFSASLERFWFQTTCATAQESLYLSSSTRSNTMSTMVESPFLAALPLRIEGTLANTQTTPPPLLAHAGDHDITSWLDSANRGDIRALVPEIFDPLHRWSISDLEIYERCHLRFLLSRLLRLDSRDADPTEEAALSGLQHRLLSDAYTVLRDEGLWPPRTDNDVNMAYSAAERIIQSSLRRYQGTITDSLWRLDVSPVTDMVLRFIQRDLTRMKEIANGQYPGLLTKLLFINEELGAPPHLVPVTRDITWYLQGRIARLETVHDERLETPSLSKLQGLSIVSNYRASRTYISKKSTADLLAARRLALPLAAHLATERTGRRIFALQELSTSQLMDNPALSVRDITLQNDQLSLERRPGLENISNPVEVAVDAALTRATSLVKMLLAGDCTPQPERNCFGCPHSRSCPAAKTSASPRRSPLPIAVSLAPEGLA